MPLPPISTAFDIDELDLLNPEDEDFCTIHPLSGKTKHEHLEPNHLGTSLRADICQEINRVSAFCRCLNGTFP